MDRLEQYRTTLQKVLYEHAQLSQRVRAEHPDDPESPAEAIAVCDRTTDNYLLITTGWTPSQRIHSILAHFRIVDDRIYIEWCGIEDLIEDSIERGIPESAFLPARSRSIASSTAV
ncbi:MAG: element excision factor XisI family protein [Cyanobacteriota bacterium]|nr:element excision factor XisI family protein [Cyanobacteriota bacterium]